MPNREKALEIADAVYKYATIPDPAGMMPDFQIALQLGSALILMLADISERLEEIEEIRDALWSIRADGIGVGE